MRAIRVFSGYAVIWTAKVGVPAGGVEARFSVAMKSGRR
jgi:hypothetical protein